jgi:hypothetical protein
MRAMVAACTAVDALGPEAILELADCADQGFGHPRKRGQVVRGNVIAMLTDGFPKLSVKLFCGFRPGEDTSQFPASAHSQA